LVELHEERESPPVAAAVPAGAADHDVFAREPAAASPPRRVVLPEEISGAAAAGEPQSPASAAHAQPVAPHLQQPAAAEPVPSTRAPGPQSAGPQSAQALHLEAVQQVVEWIAAAPQPTPVEQHEVREIVPANAVTQAPARVALDPAARTATRLVAAPSEPVVRESPSSSSKARSEPLAVPERVVVQAPAMHAVSPARAESTQPDAAESSSESLSVSIGSIQVTVEAPPQPLARAPAAASHAATPASEPASSRLARHYLRPY
jgi:hypothetical protein